MSWSVLGPIQTGYCQGPIYSASTNTHVIPIVWTAGNAIGLNSVALFFTFFFIIEFLVTTVALGVLDW